MSFLSYITGTVPQEEQDAILAKQKAAFDAALQRRLDTGEEVTPERQAELRRYVNALNDDSEAWAATVGAVQGATELVYDPSQWWKDTQAGADIAGNAAADAAKKGSQLVTNQLSKVLKAVPVWAWVAVAALAFLYIGGLGIIARNRQ